MCCIAVVNFNGRDQTSFLECVHGMNDFSQIVRDKLTIVASNFRLDYQDQKNSITDVLLNLLGCCMAADCVFLGHVHYFKHGNYKDKRGLKKKSKSV